MRLTHLNLCLPLKIDFDMRHKIVIRHPSHTSLPPPTQPESSNLTINTTPLIDVMLVLLVIFILASPVVSRVLWAGIANTLPSAELKNSTPAPKQTVQLQIDTKGRIWLNQKMVLDPNQMSDSELMTHLRQVKQKNPSASLILYADKETRYAMLSRLLERAREAGFEDVAIAVDPIYTP
jgi:biopolymer transport protein ExbD